MDGREVGRAYQLGGLRIILAVALFGSIGVSGAWPGAALAAAGDLDPSFGSGGKVITSFSLEGHANAMALQADGKIILAGSAARGGASDGGDLFVARLDPNGRPDLSFGSGGMARTNFGGADDFAKAVAIQTDGKIVAAGDSEAFDGSRFVLARFNGDGGLDPSFGSGGKIVEPTLSSAKTVAIQTDGKIVAAGDGFNPATGNHDIGVARYNRDGSRDPSLDADGLVRTEFGIFAQAHGVALQGDGKIVVAGASTVGGILARYNRDGSLDSSFGSTGKVTIGTSVQANAVALQDDGKIVVAGAGGGGFALARFNSGGTPDPSFGSGGKVTTDFGSGNDAAFGVALQANGKIVAAGGTNELNSGGDFALARYTQHGRLDPSFGNGGKVTTDFGGVEFATGVAIQRDGRIVAAGYAAGGAHSAVARYLSG